MSSVNVFDFQFFTILASLDRLTPTCGMLIVDVCVKIGISQVSWHQMCKDLIKKLVPRFTESVELLTYFKQLMPHIQSLFIQYTAQLELAQKMPKRNSEDTAILKLNERLLVSMLQFLFNLQVAAVNEVIATSLADTLLVMQNEIGVESKAVKYLLVKTVKKIDVFLTKRDDAGELPTIPKKIAAQLQKLKTGEEANSPQKRTSLLYEFQRWEEDWEI